MSTGLGQLMAELDKAGMRIGQDQFGRWNFIRVRDGPVSLRPDLADAIRARWADAVLFAQGRYDEDDADVTCVLCSAWVTPVGVKEGMVLGLCDRRTDPSECDKKAVLCPYRRK